MSLQPSSTREDENSDVGIVPGVVAQDEAVAASNAARNDPSTGQDEVSASGNGQTPAGGNSITDLQSSELGRTEYR